MHGLTSEQASFRAYESAVRYAQTHNLITYDQFDRDVLKEIKLFDVPNEAYFHAIEDMLDRIIGALPAMKHIFAKPLIRLRDTHELRPIETVRVIDNRTLAHVALHSEVWENVTSDGRIVPRKLLTIENTETYAIYENLVFARVVDAVLQTVARMKLVLKDILYGCSDFQVNLLDRTHHAFYFHAVGKLHLEYAQAQEQQYSVYLRCVEKIRLIEQTIHANLRSRVYVACRKKKKNVVLKKSNAFRSHKDYKQIYLLFKWLETHRLMEQKSSLESELVERNEYGKFCLFMSIFAIGHFNFVFSESQQLDFENLRADAAFKSWKLHLHSVKAVGVNAIVFEMEKDRVYKSCLVLSEKKEISSADLELLKETVQANEYLFASANVYGEKDTVYISLYNIDSFRRIQQILLRAMLYADEEKKECPFCGGELAVGEFGFECPICRADYRSFLCPETKKQYYVSAIKKHTFLSTREGSSKRRDFLQDRYSEAQLHFRNITPITEDGEALCPFCGKKHAEEQL